MVILFSNSEGGMKLRCRKQLISSPMSCSCLRMLLEGCLSTACLWSRLSSSSSTSLCPASSRHTVCLNICTQPLILITGQWLGCLEEHITTAVPIGWVGEGERDSDDIGSMVEALLLLWRKCSYMGNAYSHVDMHMHEGSLSQISQQSFTNVKED